MNNPLQQILHRHHAWRAAVRIRELNEMPEAYLLLMTTLASFVVFALSLVTGPAAIEWFRVVGTLDRIPLQGWLWAALLVTFGVTIVLFYELARAHGRALMEKAMRAAPKLHRIRSAAAERLRQQRQPRHKRT